MIQKSDRLALAGMFVLGATVGAAFIRSTRDAFFYQQFTPEVVMWACGRGLLYVVDKPAALLDFLFGRQPVFDCGALDLVRHTQAAGFFVKSQLYLDMVVGALWRAFGVSYVALWPIFALLHGAYAAGCFALSRLFYRLPLALGLAIVATLSPVAVGMLFALRDYSKAPFFIWCIVLLLLALRAARPSQAILFGALAGLVVGVGVGFRSDTMMLVPIGALLPLIGSNAALSRWPVRALTLAAFVGAALAAASPILALGGGGGFGTLIMQGATDPFDRFLGVTPGPYSLGWSYSDELTFSTVTAALRPVDPAWDAHESSPAAGNSQALTRSTGYVLGWAALFAGDFATHALKSAGWIAGYAALAAPSHRMLDPAGALLPNVWFGKLLDPFYAWLSSPILPWLGCAGLLCLLLQVFARNPRESLAFAVLLFVLLTYPAIQFSIRHLFHLEILSWMGLLALVLAPLNWRQTRPAAAAFAVWCLGGAAVIGAVYLGLIALQNYLLPLRVAALLRLPRQPITTQVSTAPDGRVALAIPLPEKYRGLVSGRADSMDIRMPEVGNEWEVRATADRLAITIGGLTCPPGRFALGVQYRKRADVWQPLDHEVMVTAPQDAGQRTIVVLPAFYRPTQFMEALVAAPGREACIERVERIVGANQLPLSFSAVLNPDWRTGRWRQGFGLFSIGAK